LDILSDNALMLKVKDGDLEKLGLLFERYQKILFTFYYRMNFNAELSEDLVQNVFMRILKYKHAFKGDGEFKTWMFHIARNVSHDHFKKETRLGKKEDIENIEHKINATEDLNELQNKELELGLLQNALQDLNEEKREIITLSKLKGIKYKEIGAILNCSEGAVKVKVFRAMNDLRKAYDKIKVSYE